MAAPLLQAQIDIEAPAAKVWNLVSDFSRMPEWSPQCRRMTARGPLQAGTRTININRRGMLFWPTTAKLTEVSPEKKLSFVVNENGTEWSYELQPTATGTRLIETRRAANGVVKPLSAFLTRTVFGGMDSFEGELVDGMNASLSRIKAAAERG